MPIAAGNTRDIADVTPMVATAMLMYLNHSVTDESVAVFQYGNSNMQM